MSVEHNWQAIRIEASALLSRRDLIEAQPHIAYKLSTGQWFTIDQFKTERDTRNVLGIIQEPDIIQMLEATIAEADNG